MSSDTTGGKGEALLSVKGLEKHFPITKGLLRRTVGAVRAVDGIDFEVYKGETVSYTHLTLPTNREV